MASKLCRLVVTVVLLAAALLLAGPHSPGYRDTIHAAPSERRAPLLTLCVV
jgi:hypothetical protein